MNATTCCERLVPKLSFTRPEGEQWTCPACDKRCVYVVDEASGSWWTAA